LVDAARKDKRVSLVIKDVSWLWRTAYNCAAQGCAEWDNAEERVPPLFDMSREVPLVPFPGLLVLHAHGIQLLETYLETALEVDEEMHLCVVFSSFAATSARGVFQFNFSRFSAQLTPIGSVCFAQARTPHGQF
jgi:hypothetical protein